ncbi:hypothetical protein PVAND_004285 [Polypedilum vanderplanki]|uniref:Fatty acyl-CoA reductase n=1 Tax=Polypedilum vanderplanki TaxID=319348 RepID=A0A9J6BXN1_POLVA|nr:hypothetical protein PVAND_004285 [Polypedilum vanderplanki]
MGKWALKSVLINNSNIIVINVIYIQIETNPLEAFYKGSTILMTGANGYLGKTLIEKLLRCFDVEKIYLLMRVKNNENVEKRLENLINETIFEQLRERNPAVFRKLIAIEVDYTAHDLNLNIETLERLHAEVQIVFNIVASVRFNEPLQDAIDINFLGTKKVVNLVLGIEKLKSFVHVSTLYSNCNRDDIDEKIYDHMLNYHQLIPIAKILKDAKNKKMEEILFDGLPNTYTLTKHFAEKLVYHQTFFIPSGIFRPAVVVSNYKDLPGYIENVNGPSMIIALTVRGYIHCIFGDSSKRANLIPVDYTINALIATAWDIHETYQERLKTCSNIPIYNYMFNENNLKWGELMKIYVPLGFHQPLQKFIWYYSYFIVSSKALFKALNFICHTIPASVMDILMLCIGKKMIYRRAYAKTEQILIIMSFFGLREWNVRNRNIQALLEKTKNFHYQRGDLDFDMRNINWHEFFRNYIPGIKRYHFKEKVGNVKQLAVYYNWMKRVHMIFKYLIYIILTKKILKVLQVLMKKLVFKMIV